MNDDEKGILRDWDASGAEIRQAMGHAISAALGEHKRAGNSVAVWDWETERVVIVPAHEIVVPDEAAAPEPIAAELSSGTGRE